MKKKKKKKKWQIVLMVLGILLGADVIFAIVLYATGLVDPDNEVYGSNLSTCFYERGLGNQGYQDVTDAVKARDEKYSEEEHVMTQTMGNVTIVFRQGTDDMKIRIYHYVIGYEFIEKKGLFYYSGEKKILIDANKAEHGYSWKETVAADLSNSTGESYKRMIKLGENYDVRPAWGVSDYEKVGDMSVDGQGVDEVTAIAVILSILVDTFFTRISMLKLQHPEIHNISVS